MDEVTLFPGWASRRHIYGPEHENEFDIDISVSGYATTCRPPEFLTRSQRAFLRLAKGYASLPKLPSQSIGNSMIEIDGMRLPPRPNEIADNFEMELNEEFDHMRKPEVQFTEEPDSADSGPQPSSSPYDTPLLQKQHRNLEARLRPFWSSVLSSRTIQISIFAVPPAQGHFHLKRDAHGYGPLLTEHVVTGPDGAFAKTFRVPWQKLCKHPLAHQLRDGSDIEHELLVAAKLLPEPAPTPAFMFFADIPKEISLNIPITSAPIRVITDIDDTVKLSNIPSGARAVFRNVFVKDLEETQIPEMGSWYKLMWERGVRFHYVSNSPFELLPVIKEFLQISDLPPGSIRLKSYNGRSFFNGLLSTPATRKRANVLEVLDGFPDSQFILIGDSGEQDLELYSVIASERPRQILAVFVRDVRDTALLDPTGSLASGLSSPTARRRSQTKKMSLPPTSAAGRPLPPLRTLSDPDGMADLKPNTSIKRKPIPKLTLPPQSFSSLDIAASGSDFKSRQRMSVDSMNSTGSSSSSMSLRTLRRATGQTMTEVEKRRMELQSRVDKARLMMEPHIVLRIFKHPQECTETDRLLESLKDRNRRPT
ncbi:hypothetical protein AZE42_01367 [Rhizopogon vesiculosus]|uniref:Phosphatidate phosphatase APP1 catalytic domain-containing protein n=1 Tax=Rhizopogon vesiculosus TaxID=180088 RepID=A0A1J8QJT3_9AGAM|nr:hypothetical protein AZE42_01367 [Rhizopogon vesiculosus]